MIEILPLMWLASVNDITHSFIKNKNVKNAINCSKMEKINMPNVEILDFPINKNNLIKSNFEIILGYIHRHMESNLVNNRSIVIYCLDGETYSPFLALLYIIKYGKMDRLKAIECLQSKLKNILHLKLDFDYFLKKYY
jgi:hypothetical protein